MITNKKGVSTIVITVIMVVLVLVAVGIDWAVVNNLITKSAGGADVAGKCLGIDVRATAVSATCVATCTVTLSRTGAGDDVLAGVKVVFRDTVAGTSTLTAIDSPNDVPALTGRNTLSLTTGVAAPNKVEITPYFKDASGNDQLCQTTTSFEF